MNNRHMPRDFVVMSAKSGRCVRADQYDQIREVFGREIFIKLVFWDTAFGRGN